MIRRRYCHASLTMMAVVAMVAMVAVVAPLVGHFGTQMQQMIAGTVDERRNGQMSERVRVDREDGRSRRDDREQAHEHELHVCFNRYWLVNTTCDEWFAK